MAQSEVAGGGSLASGERILATRTRQVATRARQDDGTRAHSYPELIGGSGRPSTYSSAG